MNDRHRGFIEPCLFRNGIGEVAIVRRKNGDTSEVGLFLVDVHCCGIKRTIYELVANRVLNEILSRSFSDIIASEVPAGRARHLVESAVRYAANHGLSPHSGYKKACRVLGGLEAVAPEVPWHFGEDGVPLYVQSHYDSGAKVEHIIRCLSAHCGDKFNYLIEAHLVERFQSIGIRLPKAKTLLETTKDDLINSDFNDAI